MAPARTRSRSQPTTTSNCSQANPAVCTTCGRHLKKTTSPDRHKKTHEQHGVWHACAYCNYLTRDLYNAMPHTEAHFREVLLRCVHKLQDGVICTASFSTPEERNDHRLLQHDFLSPGFKYRPDKSKRRDLKGRPDVARAGCEDLYRGCSLRVREPRENEVLHFSPVGVPYYVLTLQEGDAIPDVVRGANGRRRSIRGIEDGRRREQNKVEDDDEDGDEDDAVIEEDEVECGMKEVAFEEREEIEYEEIERPAVQSDLSSDDDIDYGSSFDDLENHPPTPHLSVQDISPPSHIQSVPSFTPYVASQGDVGCAQTLIHMHDQQRTRGHDSPSFRTSYSGCDRHPRPNGHRHHPYHRSAATTCLLDSRPPSYVPTRFPLRPIPHW